MCRSPIISLPHSLHQGVYGDLKSDGEEYQVVKWEREYHGCWESLMWIREKGDKFHLLHNIKVVGKNNKWGRGGGDGNI